MQINTVEEDEEEEEDKPKYKHGLMESMLVCYTNAFFTEIHFLRTYPFISFLDALASLVSLL